MSLFNQLPEEDVQLFHRYINWYGGGGDGYDCCSLPLYQMEYFLRFWSEAKAPFYKMFGEKFVIKQPISFERNIEEMEEEMDQMICYGDSAIQNFINLFCRKIDTLDLSYSDRHSLKSFVKGATLLTKNVYDDDPITIPATATVDGHPLQINRGCKVVKMVGKIAKALDIKYTTHKCPRCNGYHEHGGECDFCHEPLQEIDGYETFRRAHSLVLNQRTIRGDLCLSIHPLDFITMSDNDSGWSSCMSWVDEPGDYRLGTIEMMNSKSVIIAYVEAKTPMQLCDDATWNNKRWRQLVVVTPDLILGNKQYPYFNDTLQGAVLKWVRQLAEPIDGFGPYETEAVQLINDRYNVIGLRNIYVNLYFNYMYNDIYDKRMAFIRSNFNKDRLEMNLSGPAVCTSCGEVIPAGDVEPSWTTCRDCNGMWKCDYCGEWHWGEPNYSEVSDEVFCDYCWDRELDRCEICGDRVRGSHMHRVYINLLELDDPLHELACFNWTYTIDMCNWCFTYDKDLKKIFGEITEEQDMWGHMRQVVKIDNITDEGLEEYGDLSSETIETLKLIRDTKSFEDRVSLIKKYL